MTKLHLELTDLEIESLESLDEVNSESEIHLNAVVTGHGMIEIGASCAGSGCGSCGCPVCPPNPSDQ